MNFKDKYLSEQIITYLGNKRKLIEFINRTVDNIILNDDELSKKEKKNIIFFDIFAGSGVVSRYSKLKGFTTYSNDLEIYSYIIQNTLININKNELNNIFTNSVNNLVTSNRINKKDLIINNNYQTILNYLNTLISPEKKENLYWSIHYAPKDTNNPDFENERLFYTRENALIIDAIIELIENKKLFSEKEKNIIKTSLMYNMTYNINTSGTMKGFHNGWGGKGKNALNRILAKIELKPLPLIDGIKGKVFNDYAEKVFKNNDIEYVDIIYADPPYNQHQYSANYNHLTTLVQNDRYNPGKVKKGSRAGIRTDHTRSDFCKSIKDKNDNIKMAEKAFISFMNNINCKYIIMSYNNEGVVSIDKLIDIISMNGKHTINIEYKLHDKFKGGKATQTSNKVIEYLIIIEFNKKQDKNKLELIKLDLLKQTKKELFLDKYINIYNCCKLNLETKKNKDNTISLIKNNQIVIKVNDKLKVIEENIEILSLEEITELEKRILDILDLLEYYYYANKIEYLKNNLNKLKIKKYKKEFIKFKRLLKL